MGKCWSRVTQRSVPEEFCSEVLERGVVDKCCVAKNYGRRMM